MSSIDYLNQLAARGIQLWAQDGKLQYKGPKEAMTPALLAELRQHKPALLALLEQFGTSAGTAGLSYSQKSLWSLHRLNPDSAAYNVMFAARLDDGLDLPALARCFDYLVARHPILRTRYEMGPQEPQQRVSLEASARLQVEPVVEADPAGVLAWIEQVANQPFDLTQSPIRARLLVNRGAAGEAPSAGPRHVLLLNVHHIAADFWSLEILVRELGQLYQLALRGEPLRLPPLTLQYQDCVQREAERLQGPQGRALAAFWERELQGGLPPLALATDRPRPPVKTENGRVLELPLGERLSAAVREAARSWQLTPYVLLLSVYQLLLFLHTGQSRLLVGAPTAGRNEPGSEALMGHFVNTVVLASDLQREQAFADLATTTRALVLRALDHQDYPFPLLVERLRPPRDASRSPVYQVMYNWNQRRLAGTADDALAAGDGLIREILAASSTGTRGATHDLTLNVQDRGSDYLCAWTYNTDLFEAASIERMARQYLGLVEQVLADPRQRLDDYRLAPHATRLRVLEQVALLGRAADTAPALGADFEGHACRFPDRPAFQLADRWLSHAEVQQALHHLRGELARQGVAAGSVVALATREVAGLAVAALAAWQLGASLCLEPEGGELVVADLPLAPGGTAAAWPALQLQRQWPAGDRVAVSAARLGRCVEALAGVLGLQPDSRLLVLSGGDARLALLQGLATLARGACLCTHAALDGDTLATPAAELQAWLQRQAPTALVLPALRAADLPAEAPASLQTVLLVGEHPHAVRQLLAAQPRVRVGFLPQALVDGFIPPVAFRPEGDGWRLQAAPAAYPKALALGPFLDLADERQHARLALLAEPRRGAAAADASGLGARFHGHGDLSSAFVHHTLVETGLTAVLQPDGSLRCPDPSGRVASHRFAPFALGPVEAVLAAHPQVRQLACLVRPGDSGPRLQAFVQPRGGLAGFDAEVLEAELRDRLQQALPEDQHPQDLVFVASLPLDRCGALDAGRLPPPSSRPMASRAAPANPVEARLAEIWREVLGLPSVGMQDNFFELGGDSILAAVIVSRAQLDGLYLEPKAVFEHPSIAALARAVSDSPLIRVEQGAVTGEAAPGPAAAWFFESVQQDLSHFNLSLLLQLADAPEPARLDEALRRLAEQHDVLRSRFVRGPQGWRQLYGAADAGRLVPRLSVRHCSPGSAAWQEAIAAEQAGLDIEQGPLWRICWLQAATQADSRLLLVAHHLLMDRISGTLLLQDLGRLYAGLLQAGAAPRLPLKTTSYKTWVEQLAEQARGDEMAADRRYWQAVCAKVAEAADAGPGFGLLPRRRRGGPLSAVSAVEAGGPSQVALSPAATAAFLAGQQAHASDADDLLLAALQRAVQAWSGTSALWIEVEGHGRHAAPGTDTSRTIGWFSAIYPLLLEAPAGESLAAAIARIHRQRHEVPRQGSGYGALRYLADTPVAAALRGLPRPGLLFTYLGALEQMVAADGWFTGQAEPAPAMRSARQAPTHGLDLSVYQQGGRLVLECRFDAALYTRPEVDELLAGLAGQLAELEPPADGAGPAPAALQALEMAPDELARLLEEVQALDA